MKELEFRILSARGAKGEAMRAPIVFKLKTSRELRGL